MSDNEIRDIAFSIDNQLRKEHNFHGYRRR